MPGVDTKFTRADLEYNRRNRLHTDYLRTMRIYKAIRGKFKTKTEESVSLSLGIAEISRETGLTEDMIRRKIGEIKDLGVIDYEGKGPANTTEIKFIPGKGSSYLDRMLEKDEKEGLL